MEGHNMAVKSVGAMKPVPKSHTAKIKAIVEDKKKK
jgi:hypothetical protein